MANKKIGATPATAAETEAAAVQAEEITPAAEKAEERANTEPEAAPQEAPGQPETVKLVYIGPNLPKAMLQSNKIFEGNTEKDIEKELSKVLEKFPAVRRLLVPISELADKKEKIKTAGNIYNKYYSDLQSSAVAFLETEV